MSSEQEIDEIGVVEKSDKPKKIIKINYKKLYQNELKRRKNAEISLEEKKNELTELKLLLKLKEKEIEENKVKLLSYTNSQTSSEETTSQLKVVEQTAKPQKCKIKKKNPVLIESITNKTENNDKYNKVPNSFTTLATYLINKKHEQKKKRDIWGISEWKNISKLENDDVGGVGEEIIDKLCKKSQIVSEIDGTKTKQVGGGIGDGTINGETCEIKTARLGSSGSSFQHELGEVPWNAKYMIFFDIAPKKMYITIFQNFTQEFYKKSGVDSSNKCSPYFPTKSVTWRKQKGAFKLDTSININEKNINTFIIDSETTDYSTFKSFVDNIIQ
jgi:DNA-binding Xre family transcriptional regulator